MKLKLAKDLLKTSVTTLTAASSIIEKLITEAGETFTGNDHRPLGDHLFKSPGDTNKIIVEQKRSRKHKTETKTESHSSPSRKTGSSIVDNEQLTPFQSIFGEIVKAKSSLHENPMREKDFVKSGKNSLQPNSNDKERFSHPMDFPHQAEPYPHLKGSGKMPDMMQHPSPMNMMNSFAGSMLPQFESPVPLQHSMPMGPPNQGFGPGPNQQRFGSGTGPTLNRGFLPQGDPRNFMSG
ncbi:uncharacterized protein LOC132554460 [Ylistrum balloti]|uniref:uncharacterized protein LOC132554460 n=1 Tax=Ylistrum balloti TaxID=509963 RepID=UPI0029058AEB|nr:uncharacterized protein LOC132554460 [Ylistrum balloti]